MAEFRHSQDAHETFTIVFKEHYDFNVFTFSSQLSVNFTGIDFTVPQLIDEVHEIIRSESIIHRHHFTDTLADVPSGDGLTATVNINVYFRIIMRVHDGEFAFQSQCRRGIPIHFRVPSGFIRKFRHGFQNGFQCRANEFGTAFLFAWRVMATCSHASILSRIHDFISRRCRSWIGRVVFLDSRGSG